MAFGLLGARDLSPLLVKLEFGDVARVLGRVPART